MDVIEYFYSAHSAYAYLGSSHLLRLARAHQRRIVHLPIFLTPVIEAAGAVAFSQRTPAHVDYFFRREIERWSQFRSAPVMAGIPTHHHNDMSLANGLLIAGDRQGLDIDRLAHALLEAHWRDDADLADTNTLDRIARGVGIDPAPLLEAATTAAVQAQYQANTVQAIRRSVFGSPTYFLDGDMFYGQDRLEILERALQQPFPGRTGIGPSSQLPEGPGT